MAPTLQDVLAVARCTRDDFQNWARRKIFSTKFPKTTAGVARHLTRENALELAFISALVQSGIEPSRASDTVKRWLDAERNDGLTRFWAFNTREKKIALKNLGAMGCSFQSIREANFESLARRLPDPAPIDGTIDRKRDEATAIIIINRGKIVRSVDELFGREHQ